MHRLGGLVELWGKKLALVPVLCPPADEDVLEAAALVVESEGFTGGTALWVHSGRLRLDTVDARALALHLEEPVALERSIQAISGALKDGNGSIIRSA